MSKKKSIKNEKKIKSYETQAISQADSRDPKTLAAIPNDKNVTEAKDWVDFNKK